MPHLFASCDTQGYVLGFFLTLISSGNQQCAKHDEDKKKISDGCQRLATDIHVGPILNQCYQSKTIRYL
jgi:hypothetical protein